MEVIYPWKIQWHNPCTVLPVITIFKIDAISTYIHEHGLVAAINFLEIKKIRMPKPQYLKYI